MKNDRILDIVRDMRGTYESCFNHSWFYNILEDLPVDPSLVREIRSFLSYTPLDLLDMYKIRSGAESLERFIWKLNAYLLPNIKEILRVSNLIPGRRIKNKEEYLRMRLLSEVLPENIKRLAAYTSELNDALYSPEYSGTGGAPALQPAATL